MNTEKCDFFEKQFEGRMAYIFGSGKRGTELLPFLKCINVEVEGFVDNDPLKVGKSVSGLQVFDLSEIEYKPNIIFFISPFDNKGISEQLEEAGFFNYFYPDELFRFHPNINRSGDFRKAVPFNAYDSPYSDLNTVRKKEKEIFDDNRLVLDIDLNLNRQFELLERMEELRLVKWSQEKSGDKRYHYGNTMFTRGSADVLCYMMQIIHPHKIIEVGSGFSTAVMLDTNNEFFDDSIEIVAIEPRTARLRSLLRHSDNLTILEKDVQEIGFDTFEDLGENDILFIDSSHVARTGGDVNYILFEILPRLKSKTYIHFHDMFWPFVYPKEWIYDGLAYNELFLLRAFLMNNDSYSIQFFGEMLQKLYCDKLSKKTRDIGGSLWIRKE